MAKHSIGREVLADQVYAALLEALLDSAYEPGQAIGIEQVSRDFGVSATPVREAMARLESTGIVKRVALRGYTVAPLPTEQEYRDLMDARLVIEPVNARLVAARISDELLTELEASLEQQRSAPVGPSFSDYRQYFEADEKFHHLIAEGAGNDYLLASYNALGGLVQRFRQFGATGVSDGNQAIAEHTAVLNALRKGDAVAAEAHMIAHLVAVRERTVADGSGPETEALHGEPPGE
ncbi:GntR family transcriptional regulator [Leucobacter sp. CSA1]|uniref:GntR family transcriptional regulator n=1 Tax=Leucobacter chromiisoli TaxID=2796471 RepID=A0A934UVT9_9MICO|nr:GntR family transcriptional regulator [Leucobacter chromiisoli]MBK0419568.1 GntR family transcriptional regulator [Leucobacter chromiisoli]